MNTTKIYITEQSKMENVKTENDPKHSKGSSIVITAKCLLVLSLAISPLIGGFVIIGYGQGKETYVSICELCFPSNRINQKSKSNAAVVLL